MCCRRCSRVRSSLITANRRRDLSFARASTAWHGLAENRHPRAWRGAITATMRSPGEHRQAALARRREQGSTRPAEPEEKAPQQAALRF